MKMNHFLRFSRSGERGVRSKIAFKLLMLVLLAVPASMLNEVQAQTEPEAFYIYRNDGDFDGFFYDRVLRMNFSKIGVDSVEYDYYVVQEIETPDSIYRIPLAAIDSIGFQQPEIRFSPKLKHMDELGITPYVEYIQQYGTTVTLYISPDISKSLLPQVGDVVVGFDDEKYSDGFAGKITSMHEPGSWGTNYYIYETEKPTEISDIFEQFITIEQIGVDDEGNLQRRIAGCNPDGTMRNARHAYDGNYNKKIVDVTATLQQEWKPKDNVSITLAADIGVEAGLQVTYNINWRRIFIKFSRYLDIEAEPSLGITAEADPPFYAKLDIMPSAIKKIRFPANLPIFQSEPFPEFFIRGGGSLSAKLTFPKMYFGVEESIVFDSDLPVFPMRYDLHRREPSTNPNSDVVDTRSASLSLDGFVQTGIKFSANLSSIDWISDIFYSGIYLDVYCGPKIEGSLQVSVTDNDEPDTFYWLLRDSNIKISKCAVDFEAKASAGLFWYDPVERTFLKKTWALGADTLYAIQAVPGFTQPDNDRPFYGLYNVEKNSWTITLIKNPNQRKVFIPYKMGLAISRNGWNNPYALILTDETYGLTKNFEQETFEISCENMPWPTGTFNIASVIHTLGRDCILSHSEQVYLPHKLQLLKTGVNFSRNGGTATIDFKTTARSVRVINTDWAHCSVELGNVEDGWQYGTIHITVDPNEKPEERSYTHDVHPYNPDELWGDDSKTDEHSSFSIYQSGTP